MNRTKPQGQAKTQGRRSRPIVFLDRDGTLIEERNYLRYPRDVVLLPGVGRGLRRLQAAGFPLVALSNQSGVARGLISRRDVERVHRRLGALLRKERVRLNGLYWCPHGPGDHCVCRKPKTGLVKKAAKRLRLPASGHVSVGDRWSDIAVGQRAGGRGVLVLTGYGSDPRYQRRDVRPDCVAKDFREAVNWIMKQKEFKR